MKKPTWNEKTHYSQVRDRLIRLGREIQLLRENAEQADAVAHLQDAFLQNLLATADLEHAWDSQFGRETSSWYIPFGGEGDA